MPRTFPESHPEPFCDDLAYLLAEFDCGDARCRRLASARRRVSCPPCVPLGGAYFLHPCCHGPCSPHKIVPGVALRKHGTERPSLAGHGTCNENDSKLDIGHAPQHQAARAASLTPFSITNCSSPSQSLRLNHLYPPTSAWHTRGVPPLFLLYIYDLGIGYKYVVHF